ncbi:hypothetical protein RvY_16292 [Ramazzottius varieornatus]|uniref:Uncharacterized protein n=1 Tax=Ramazzottius varieornatus TaxID=947166 RepID=A0A1D1VXW9_RAMVA|nr:hypothetical protein RvY_16292 [Ramazzottius varieornatus]
MQGKSRYWIIAACVLEILYGLAFMAIGVACSYLAVPRANTSPVKVPLTWQAGSEAGTGMDYQSDYQIRKEITGQGIWLSILYVLTGFLGVVTGQENDRVVPLLHTILALVCITWAPLMWEMLYLLVRPASTFPYSFLYEMDFITSQSHWIAYIVTICVVVAGSALYLFSAALAAYQYGLRMVDRSVALKESSPRRSHLDVEAVRASPAVTRSRQSLAMRESKSPEATRIARSSTNHSTLRHGSERGREVYDSPKTDLTMRRLRSERSSEEGLTDQPRTRSTYENLANGPQHSARSHRSSTATDLDEEEGGYRVLPSLKQNGPSPNVLKRNQEENVDHSVVLSHYYRDAQEAVV